MQKTLKGYFREYGGRPRRSLGQVFLIDSAIQQKILDLADLEPDDTVLEIGPGTGALTRDLLPQVKKLIALEIDPALTSYLNNSLSSSSNLLLVCINALDFSYQKAASRLNTKLKVVGNLPYVISTPLLFRFIEQRKAFSLLILMVQKEVALRLTAVPGTKAYGAITVLCGFYFKITLEKHVSRHCFHPVPKVESAVIRCVPRKKNCSPGLDEELFRRVVKGAFSKRRKTIYNALRLSLQPDLVNIDLAEILRKTVIDSKRRPETISLEEFLQLTLCIQENL